MTLYVVPLKPVNGVTKYQQAVCCVTCTQDLPAAMGEVHAYSLAGVHRCDLCGHLASHSSSVRVSHDMIISEEALEE